MIDTIAAISTGGVTNDPISIIRISGSDSFKIMKKIFTGKKGENQSITYGYIHKNNQKIDEVLVSWFVSPNTFTGEDIVEINAHGGIVNTHRILQLILSNGARIAENGEFSRRAFINGKMDLIKAEAIHDLIFSKTHEQADLSIKKFDGTTSTLINELKNKLLHIIATIETNIDYPEYDDIEDLTKIKLLPRLNEVLSDFDEIIKASRSSRYIYDGIDVAIVGKPNAGKSSLLNAILNENKAIVTNVPGTTRDVVEGSIQIGQVLLNFKDTAGIHKTDDYVEGIGIEKSLEQVDKAKLVIHLIDPTDESDHSYLENKLHKKNYIKVYNKSDLKFKQGISISAKDKKIKPLINEIKSRYRDIDLHDKKIINNIRQLALIEKSRNSIMESINGLNNYMTPDTVIIDIQKAWEELSNILGRAEDSSLLDEMFKTFCLGK